MVTRAATSEHEVAYQDLCDLLKKHSENVSALEMLAIAANLVGKLVALQDQRSTTPAGALDVVAKNIEAGNLTVIQQLAGLGPEGI